MIKYRVLRSFWNNIIPDLSVDISYKKKIQEAFKFQLKVPQRERIESLVICPLNLILTSVVSESSYPPKACVDSKDAGFSIRTAFFF